jgi:hypothetical protein
MGLNSSVGIATRYGLNGPEIESRWRSEILHTLPDRSWGPPASCTIGTGSLSWALSRQGVTLTTHPPRAEVKERVELYPYSPSGPSRSVLGWALLYFIISTLVVALIFQVTQVQSIALWVSCMSCVWQCSCGLRKAGWHALYAYNMTSNRLVNVTS